MSSFCNSWFALVWWCVASSVLASTPNPANNCKYLQSWFDVLPCAVSRDIDVIKSQADQSVAMLGAEAYEQGLNPEFESELITRDAEGEQRQSLSLSYRHTFELGSKAKMRSELGRAEEQVAASNLELTQQRAFAAYAMKLFRMKAKQEELEYLDEMRSSYQRIVNAYRSRRALSAETRVSAQIFSLAEASSLIRTNRKKGELRKLASSFASKGLRLPKGSVGLGWPQWPQIKPQLGESPWIKLYRAESNLAESKLNVEESLATPNLKIGPIAEFDDIGQGKVGLGLSMSLDLPVYHQNQGSINRARQQVKGKKLVEAAFQSEHRERFSLLLDHYKSLQAELQALPSQSWLEKNHEQLDREIAKGLIDANLIVEGHEQLLSVVEERNQLRLRVLETLFDIRLIQGSSVQEGIL
ncbi:hypothetical protein [Pseudobacteriovorax antillogorgiicola]|uniref:Outer membrane protein TolC n=1 Tax=Pseudobacteriovorax antillogorgiicola TaxID=1513793 RepID=A0A1Y6C3D7_9BACT|nr:hypothetical protein [Pseudobacteriovorax antillogorgiicola]TCS50653.1 hypothetical protein EDD56_11235 [Pseudobacteriovorax antillogorgiicola]SMF39727.1 hypothetical protein SAMN06296036_11234 [Pseudobacteriovorax antillogorgiicola]